MHCVQHQHEKEIVYIGKFLSPSPVRKKLITWSGSDEGKIALHSLDRDFQLSTFNFIASITYYNIYYKLPNITILLIQNK